MSRSDPGPYRRRAPPLAASLTRSRPDDQGTLVAMTDGTAGDLAAWARSLPDQPEIPLPYPSLPTALLAGGGDGVLSSPLLFA